MKNPRLVALFFFLLIPGIVSAADNSTTASKASGLHAVDWVLLVLYACSTIALGWYFGRQQKDTKEYFVGSGKMNPFFIGVSLFATLLSTISYLSMPGEALGKGPVHSITFLCTLPLIYFTVAHCILPVYAKQRVTSAYELLEAKLGISVRMLGATMFLILRLVWMSLLIFLAAKAMTVMMGVDKRFIPLIVLITGFVSVIYASLGGLRAVVVTDFMQTLLLFGGAILVLCMVTWSFRGFGWFPTTWQSSWDHQPFFSTDPKTRVTVVGTCLTVFVWFVATLGGDQTSVQRFMATENVKAARRALATQLTVSAIVAATLCLVGFALISQQPKGMKADDVFPHFIAYELPIGISGLVVAAMFAAAMSSVDSGVNSITAVVMTDYLERFGRKPRTEKARVILARVLAFSIGGVVVIGSSFMEHVPGNITKVTNVTVNLLTTPIFALFFFALFVPFSRPIGVWIGAVCGIVTAVLIAFSGPWVEMLYHNFGVDPAAFGTGWVTKEGKMVVQDPISFQWTGPIALAVNLAVGTIVSLLAQPRSHGPK